MVPKGAALYNAHSETATGSRCRSGAKTAVDEVIVIDTTRNQVVSRIRLVPEARP